MEAEERVYWESFVKDKYGGDNGTSLKYRDGKVIFEGRDFDVDEQKQYTAVAFFTLEALQKGLRDLQEQGSGTVKNDTPNLAEEIQMCRDGLTENIDIFASAKFGPFHFAGFRHRLLLKELLD